MLFLVWLGLRLFGEFFRRICKSSLCLFLLDKTQNTQHNVVRGNRTHEREVGKILKTLALEFLYRFFLRHDNYRRGIILGAGSQAQNLLNRAVVSRVHEAQKRVGIEQLEVRGHIFNNIGRADAVEILPRVAEKILHQRKIVPVNQ